MAAKYKIGDYIVTTDSVRYYQVKGIEMRTYGWFVTDCYIMDYVGPHGYSNTVEPTAIKAMEKISRLMTDAEKILFLKGK